MLSHLVAHNGLSYILFSNQTSAAQIGLDFGWERWAVSDLAKESCIVFLAWRYFLFLHLDLDKIPSY